MTTVVECSFTSTGVHLSLLLSLSIEVSLLQPDVQIPASSGTTIST